MSIERKSDVSTDKFKRLCYVVLYTGAKGKWHCVVTIHAIGVRQALRSLIVASVCGNLRNCTGAHRVHHRETAALVLIRALVLKCTASLYLHGAATPIFPAASYCAWKYTCPKA